MNEQTTPQSKRRFVSLRVKLLLGFTLAFAVLFAAIFYWFYTYATTRAYEQIVADMKTTLQGAVDGVDAEQFYALYQDERAKDDRCPPADGAEENGYYPEDPRYWEHVTWLNSVYEIEPRARVYTYVAGDNPGEIIFVGSNGAMWDPPDGAPFCLRYTPESNIAQGLVQPTYTLKIYEDPWGKWITGYTPIKDDEGNIVGALGVDFEASFVEQVEKEIIRAVLITSAISYTILFLIVYLVSGVFTRPMSTLTRAAERIGEGDYDQNLTSTKRGVFSDEIDILAHVFTIMIGKVAQREQTLRKRVKELEIMVDTQKRDEQVKEIVDSDFFQDLQAKAARLRRRGQSDEPTGESD